MQILPNVLEIGRWHRLGKYCASHRIDLHDRRIGRLELFDHKVAIAIAIDARRGCVDLVIVLVDVSAPLLKAVERTVGQTLRGPFGALLRGDSDVLQTIRSASPAVAFRAKSGLASETATAPSAALKKLRSHSLSPSR